MTNVSDEFKILILESYEFDDKLMVDPNKNKKLYNCQLALKLLSEDKDITLDIRIESLILYAWFINVESSTPVETLFEISPSTEKIINQAMSLYLD